MNNTRPISEHSRQELYDLIWSTSALKLEAHFGISSVAIAKHCKRLNVPRPGRGYWARIQAGQTPRKAPLPLTADESLKKAAQRRTPQTLSIPAATEPLLPLAAELLTALAKAELDDYKRTKLQKPTFPEVSVSKILVERVARAFHVLLNELQPFGIVFRKFQGIYHTGYFQRHGDRLYVAITEELVRPDGSRGVSLWAWPQEKANPCGYLTFSFRPGKYSDRETQQWSEDAKVSLGKTLAAVVDGIRKHFLEIQERRDIDRVEVLRRHSEWLKKREELEKQEAIRLEQEKERKRVEAIAAAVAARKKALLQAADNWRQSNMLLEFVDACGSQWEHQKDGLSPEQIAWVAWARGIAADLSPFSIGYPDMAKEPSS